MAADVAPLKAAVGRWARDVHGDALDAMPDLMRPYAPRGKIGQLQGAIRRDRSIIEFSADTVVGRIEAPVPQAKWTDEGTEAHVIRPKKVGGVLVFEMGGQTVFARVVNHPGNVARPWWRRALNATWGPSLRYAAIKRSLR